VPVSYGLAAGSLCHVRKLILSAVSIVQGVSSAYLSCQKDYLVEGVEVARMVGY